MDQIIEPTLDTGIIYSVTCSKNGKCYIGQAKDYKYKNDKPYRYGLKGRMSDHVSSTDNTPIHQAMRKYGSDCFTIEFILRCDILDLDGWEAKYISSKDSLVPKGYNVMKHSRVKNRDDTNISDFYLENAINIKVNPVRRNGEHRLVYVYIEDVDKTQTRLTFGQSKDSSFEEARQEALNFIEPFKLKNVPISLHPCLFGTLDRMSQYKEKIDHLNKLDITKITVSKNKCGNFQLIVLKICHPGCQSKKDEIKICFGGKTIDTLEAYNISKEFIQRIKNQNTEIVETNILIKFLKFATGSCE